MDALFTHHLRRLLLLHGGSVHIQALPSLWHTAYGVPLTPQLHGFSDISQLLASVPSACIVGSDWLVRSVVHSQAIHDLTALVTQQVCVFM